MKKVLSISLAVLMMAAVLHFAVAVHYCNGKVAATNISLSGRLASCGMENHNYDLPHTGTYLYSTCCRDLVTFLGVDNNWAPSFTIINPPIQVLTQVFDIPLELPYRQIEKSKISNTTHGPPGVLMPTQVDLCEIHNFRI